MAISMRVLDGDQPGGVAVEWCDGARCIQREITGPWPTGFQAIQAAVLAELAGGMVVANQEPEPACYLDAPAIDVPVIDRATGEALPDPPPPAAEKRTCMTCLRKYRGAELYCSTACEDRARSVRVGDHRTGRWGVK
jgi:hypothetical protein